MSRISATMAAVLCAALLAQPGLAESPNLIGQESIRQEEVNYKTHVVENETYSRSVSSTTTEYYPYTYRLCFDVSGAKFGEYLVQRGDEVKAGDALATFILEADELKLASMQLTLRRLGETLEAQRLAKAEEIEALEAERLDAKDSFERELLTLRVERAALALEQYVYQQEQEIARLERELADLEEDMAANVLVAPADGVIANLAYKRYGERISTTDELVVLYQTDHMLLRFSNGNGYFRYGMEVNVEVGPNKQRQTLTGHIVGTDTMVPGALKDGYAYIELDPFDPETVDFRKPSVNGFSVYLENVMTVPRKAVVMDGGKCYVSKLVDGMVQKRYIGTAMSNTTDVWVLRGLETGETIIID